MILIKAHNFIDLTGKKDTIAGLLKEYRINKNFLRRLDDEAKAMLLCTLPLNLERLKKEIPKEKIGIILGTDISAMQSYETFTDGFLNKNVQPQAFSSALPGYPASVISLYFGFKGICLTLIDKNGGIIKALSNAFALLKDTEIQYILTGGFSIGSYTKDKYKNIHHGDEKNMEYCCSILLEKSYSQGTCHGGICIEEIEHRQGDPCENLLNFFTKKIDEVYLIGDLGATGKSRIEALIKGKYKKMIDVNKEFKSIDRALHFGIPFLLGKIDRTAVAICFLENERFLFKLSKSTIHSLNSQN